MLALRTTRSVLWVLRRPPQRPGQKSWAEKGIFQGILRELLLTRKQVQVLSPEVVCDGFVFCLLKVVNNAFFWHLPSTHAHGHAQPPNHGCLAWLDKAMAHEKMLIQHGHMPNITDEQQKQMEELQLALREQRTQELTRT